MASESPKSVEGQAAAGSGQSPSKTTGVKETKPKNPPRPNYGQIHSKSLPFEVYPLPAFIPHNPLSIVRIAITLITHSIWPPSSLLAVHGAYFSPETQSVHVTDPQSIRALWEQGFWGTGSLSRSEPRWLDLEKRKRGLQASQTSEEITAQRRRERRQFKLERARLEREAIEEQRRLEAEGLSPEVAREKANATVEGMAKSSPDAEKSEQKPQELQLQTPRKVSDTKNSREDTPDRLPEELELIIEDQEHLQLTLEEAFFLQYGLGTLSVSRNGKQITTTQLFRSFCANSTCPVSEDTNQFPYTPVPTRDLGHVFVGHLYTNCDELRKHKEAQDRAQVQAHAQLQTDSTRPDNPFLLKYIVLHHYRSLGWVVRPGIKFAVDYLLYNRGPAFTHAEFAIMILPSYSHPYWSETEERKQEAKEKQSRDWWWLHRVNRVQTQVHKTLMLVYVEIPPPWDIADTVELDIGGILKKYKVREFTLGRWAPNRQRK